MYTKYTDTFLDKVDENADLLDGDVVDFISQFDLTNSVDVAYFLLEQMYDNNPEEMVKAMYDVQPHPFTDINRYNECIGELYSVNRKTPRSNYNWFTMGVSSAATNPKARQLHSEEFQKLGRLMVARSNYFYTEDALDYHAYCLLPATNSMTQMRNPIWEYYQKLGKENDYFVLLWGRYPYEIHDDMDKLDPNVKPMCGIRVHIDHQGTESYYPAPITSSDWLDKPSGIWIPVSQAAELLANYSKNEMMPTLTEDLLIQYNLPIWKG